MFSNNIIAKMNNKFVSIFYRIEISKLFVILLLFFGIALISVFMGSTYHKIYDTVYLERITKLKYVADFAIKILDHQNSLVQNHQKTLNQAQKEAIQLLKKVRFENSDYIGIISDKGTFIYPPYSKFVKDAKIDAKINELRKKSEGGYFRYRVSNINKDEKRYSTKVSYVEGYNNWHWVVVTGLYIDDIRTKVISSMLDGFFAVFIVLILLIMFFLYVVWTTIIIPTEELADKSLKLANSDLDVVIPESQYNTEFGKLYRAFRKLAEVFKEKIDNEKRISQIIEGLGDVIITADNKGTIMSANPAVGKMFGFTPEEIIGKNVDLLTSPSLFSGDINDFTGIKSVYNRYELLGLKKEETFPIEVDVNQIKNNGDELFVLLIRNITSKKEVEEVKNEFVHIVGSELKTPLVEIKESLESKLNYEFSNVETRVKSFIKNSYEEIQELITLIDDILDIEKLEEGKIEFKYEVSNLFEMIEHVISINQPFADKSKVSYKFINNIPKDTLINIDKKRFSQILTNLLSNATKFSPENSDVIILTSIKNYSIQISVKDYGTGIPPEFENKIFTKFARASGLENKQKGGSGLGLHICKRLIEEMDGRISFETEVGKGTTFHISFPIYVKGRDKKKNY